MCSLSQHDNQPIHFSRQLNFGCACLLQKRPQHSKTVPMHSDPASKPRRWFENCRAQTWLAFTLWALPLLVIAGMVIADPCRRSVVPVYHKAVVDWWAQQNLYDGWSYHYLPQFAVLFTPFHFLPSPLGDLLWRFVSAAVLVGGLWRWLRQLFGSEVSRAFLWGTLLVMPLSLGALRNGQANVVFGALMLQAVVCLYPRQWWAASAFMVLAVAVKPIGLVLVALAAVVYAPLRWRVALALAALAGLPFLFNSPAYVSSQYRQMFEHVQACVVVAGHQYADMGGIIRTFGGELDAVISKLVRMVAGGAVLGVWWMGARRWADPLRAMWLHALAVSYLMLFNPMTESNSYVIVAPAIGLWAVWTLSKPETRRFGWVLACMGVSMGLLPTLLRPLFGNHFALFWHPVMMIVFLAMLIHFRWKFAGITISTR